MFHFEQCSKLFYCSKPCSVPSLLEQALRCSGRYIWNSEQDPGCSVEQHFEAVRSVHKCICPLFQRGTCSQNKNIPANCCCSQEGCWTFNVTFEKTNRWEMWEVLVSCMTLRTLHEASTFVITCIVHALPKQTCEISRRVVGLLMI